MEVKRFFGIKPTAISETLEQVTREAVAHLQEIAMADMAGMEIVDMDMQEATEMDMGMVKDTDTVRAMEMVMDTTKVLTPKNLVYTFEISKKLLLFLANF